MNNHLLQIVSRVRGLWNILEFAPEETAVTILDNGKADSAVGVVHALAGVVFGVENNVLVGTNKVSVVGRVAVA